MSSLGRVLIVDDEEPVVEVLSDYFTSQGYAVRTARNGTDALAAVKRSRPDIVLLDVRMPGIDGVEVLRRIRATDGALPVIMVTANEDVALARETLKLGAFDYVAKPFDFSYLDRAVAAGLAQAGGPASGSWDEAEPPGRVETIEPAEAVVGEDAWTRLALAVFRAARGMSEIGRRSTGARLEAAALDAARDAAAGRLRQAGEQLAQIDLLVAVAAELGDLSGPSRAAVEAAVAGARTSLPLAG